MQMLPGQPYPLGSRVVRGADGRVLGVNFALFSAHASAVDLCLYSAETGGHWRQIGRFSLPQQRQQIWCGLLLGAEPGMCYGYRVDGAYQPHLGHRFNPNKLLLDPYSRWMAGTLQPGPWHLGYARVDSAGRPLDDECQLELPEMEREGAKRVSADGGIGDDSRPNSCDNAWALPRSVVVEDQPFNGQRLPSRPLSYEVIYEMHLKGFSAHLPELDESLRGTFAGLGSEVAIHYLKSLGVTCVELLPVQSFFSEPFLTDKGMSNYWGYNSIGFFAPHPAYCATADGIAEFKQMVEALHRHDIRVILDVVYNHTAEGSRLGPQYSFRGIDNASYYRLHPNDKRFYINDTGCGNCLNMSHPRVVQLVMDSLRYWVAVMGVDGFRFDLATCLGREPQGFDRGSGFFDALMQDPVLSGVILIAEPWDIGPGGYQLGQFPLVFSEWNDRYRDTVRRFWRGDHGMLPELAKRLHGSGDLFEHSGRGPCSSINFISSHDGFTLRDLVSYELRHNDANGEENRDGHHENFSCNYGEEGDSEEPKIVELRARQSRNMLATLLLSQGVPMLLAGDEQGNSQQGNNNAYCQDNLLGWVDWRDDEQSRTLMQFCQRLIAIRRQSAVFCCPRYIHTDDPNEAQALAWFDAHGEIMSRIHWAEGHCRSLQMLLKGEDENGQPEMLLLLMHAGNTEHTFTVPNIDVDCHWQLILTTITADGEPGNHPLLQAGEAFLLLPCSLLLFKAQLDV
ncbi:glycogen debranching protein GlgX [Shewanella yunxiaonensis]|uniref:Glycogen debranching protein GlgX n=1 Tax=Shewanella yunxiaonensis TaxID=2829809 RepID=A0ABX7YVE5_9GAMM|nr:glycogen debranching protein GlgX [Shewanella yunxiaonensis]QUN06659.1 glycogen debranching protein GlgX [Shewanella yunxiaonensis]